MLDDEKRFGVCNVCKQERMLESVLGSYKGQPVAAWMCHRCYVEIRDKRNEDEHTPEMGVGE